VASSLLRCMNMNMAGHEFPIEVRRLIRWASALVRLSIWAAGFGLAACFSAIATNAVMPYRIRAWQTDDGLPQNLVYAITQTADGYLWVGTREGLARFDGVRFVALGENAPAELSRGWISALCTSHDGSLWIGCEGYGLARYKDGRFTPFSEADGLLSNLIRCLLEAKDGALWIGSEGGLSRYQEGRLRNFTEKNGLASNSVKGLCQDHRGHLRIATLRMKGSVPEFCFSFITKVRFFISVLLSGTFTCSAPRCESESYRLSIPASGCRR